MTCTATSPSTTLTTSMAPSAARIPQRMAAPSKAGPAGAAVDRIRSPLPRTISQLVPTSMNSRSRLSRSMPEASMPATMSPPTYAPREGNTNARARGCRCSPRSAGQQLGHRAGRHDERRDAERLGVDAQGELGHRGVAGQRDLVDLGRVDLSLLADLAGQLVQRGVGGGGQPAQGLGVDHRRADPGDDVAAERLLLVEHRAHRDRRAGCQVEQGRDHRGRAEVEGDRVAALRGVTRLHVDQDVVDDDRGEAEVVVPQHLRQAPQGVQVHPQLDVVDGGQQPFQVGLLVGERGLGQLDEPLLQGRPQDHLAPDPDRGRLGPRHQRRHVDGDVVRRPGPGRPAASRCAAARA